MVVLYGGFGAARWKPRTPSAEVIALGPEQDDQGTLMDLSVERAGRPSTPAVACLNPDSGSARREQPPRTLEHRVDLRPLR
jgi:hypothetical protein